MNHNGYSRGRAALFLLVGLLLVMTVVAAAVIIVRNAPRIEPVQPPVHLRPQPPDIGLRRFRRSTRTRLRNAESRYERYRQQVATPTPEQESLSTVIAAELSGIRAEVYRLDSLARTADDREMNRHREPLLQRRRELFNTVSAYVRTVLETQEGPELDALNRELEWLLRDE